MASIIFAVGMRAHAFVIKFQRLEFVDRVGFLSVSAPCRGVAKNLTRHLSNRGMLQCSEKHGKNVDDGWIRGGVSVSDGGELQTEATPRR